MWIWELIIMLIDVIKFVNVFCLEAFLEVVELFL